MKKIVYKKCCNTTVLSWLCNLVSNPSEVIVKWCIYRNVSQLYVPFVRLFQQNRDEQRPWQGKILILNGRQAIGQYLNNISLHKFHYIMIVEGKICNNMQKYKKKKHLESHRVKKRRTIAHFIIHNTIIF